MNVSTELMAQWYTKSIEKLKPFIKSVPLLRLLSLISALFDKNVLQIQVNYP